jgi:pimeloyl-ACP methyl ester carboxylesterase
MDDVVDYRQADINGPVHYADFGGSGPPIVLVHGLGGSHVNWYRLAPLLTGRARVLAVDLVGFGRTPPQGRSTAVHANADLLARFVAEVAGAPAILVGNSMGGMVSLLTADRHPDHVAGLILIDPSVPQPRARVDVEVARNFLLYATPFVGERFMAWRRARLGPTGLVHETLRLCCADPARVPDEFIDASVALHRERLGMPWANSAFLAAARSILLVLARPDRYRRLIRDVDVPVLLIHGEEDRLIPAPAARQVAELRPDWTVELLAGVGHVPQIEAPDQTAAHINRWLDTEGAAALAVARHGETSRRR